MARYVVDLACALRILAEDVKLNESRAILAPTLLRSQMLDHLFQQAQHGVLGEAAALALNARFAKLRFRYLGDAVLRRRAWAIAAELGMPSTFDAEYVALTELQADALIAEDARLARLAKRRVPVLPFDALT